MTRSEAITELYALFGAPHNADINLTRLNKLLEELTEFPPAQQEPVAYMDICEKNQMSGLRYWSEPDNRHEVALYTSPPQRKPLSDEEALEIARTFGAQPWPPGSCVAFARAIEAAHGIKENT